MIRQQDRVAYEAGWQASKRTKTADLDAAERRFEAKHGADYGGTNFAGGWVDWSAGNAKWTGLLPGPSTRSTTMSPTLINVPASAVQVGDIIWKEQEMVVTRVRPLSVSTAIYAQYIGKVGPEYGGSEWLLENWQQVPVTRMPA